MVLNKETNSLMINLQLFTYLRTCIHIHLTICTNTAKFHSDTNIRSKYLCNYCNDIIEGMNHLLNI